MIKNGITTFRAALSFYIITGMFVYLYMVCSKSVNPYILFTLTWMAVGGVLLAKKQSYRFAIQGKA
jgi:hypothetical protein